ncbi:capsular polysaccharide transport system ATP-binding protein [Sphingobium xenophagum]|uniref:Capsular polysaccharide transport system ATP-binding protein n=1 Tax=Sphingobium xenophagum TaxID=121428 RepID=A0ABU1X292_SPHXE|nr:ABC transporter ATP-binding protein [Sphingobium xenophagum]MDR7155681.1 capsular polysaccharide transport system ATP-binding protein [Sphingobium xenophagum]
MIQLQNVGKAYETRRGHRWVFRNVDLSIKRGEKIGILGRNGAGKSTLIRMISGIELPTQGRIVTDMSISWPLAFSGAFQQSLTGADNVRFISRVYGKDPVEMIGLVDEFAELGRYMDEPIKSYSSGMRARLGFGISLAVDFDCFLIDEIVAVGDARFQQKCRDEMFIKRKDRAMVIVSHNDNYIREHCDSAGVLAQGTLTGFADMDEAYAFYKAHERE